MQGLTFADGSRITNGTAGLVGKTLAVYINTSALNTYLNWFSDANKTISITYYYGAYKDVYNGYTVYDSSSDVDGNPKGYYSNADTGKTVVWLNPPPGNKPADRIRVFIGPPTYSEQGYNMSLDDEYEESRSLKMNEPTDHITVDQSIGGTGGSA